MNNYKLNDCAVLVVTKDNYLKEAMEAAIGRVSANYGVRIDVRTVTDAVGASAAAVQHQPTVVLYDIIRNPSGLEELIETVGRETPGRVLGIQPHGSNRRADIYVCEKAVQQGMHDTIPRPENSYILFEKRLVGNIHDAQNSELQYIDDMTGLLNRKGFLKKLDASYKKVMRQNETERMQAQRIPGFKPRNYSMTVVVGDGDKLKEINDTFGHGAGNEAIQFMAHMLSGQKVLDKYGQEVRSPLRHDETAAHFAGRLGGDEFGLLFEGNHSHLAIGNRLSAVSEAMASYDFSRHLSSTEPLEGRVYDGGPIHRGISLGYITVPYHSVIGSPAEMMDLADGALYSLKQTKKTGHVDPAAVATYTPDGSRLKIVSKLDLG